MKEVKKMERFVRNVLSPALEKNGYCLVRSMLIKDAVNAQYVLGKHTVDLWLTKDNCILFIHKRVESSRRNEILTKHFAMTEIGSDNKTQIFVDVDVFGALEQM